MQMSSPYPLRSPLDPDLSYLSKDYDMTSPLFADGSNFPCKQYQHDDASYVVKATYAAGATYSMSISGTASHHGGSCQLSLSYDNGLTFKVIKSMIGGCPLQSSYAFTIPSNAPASSTVLFSWSWFNVVGNREMYQNCARVKIVAGPNQRMIRRSNDRSKRQSTPLQDLPDMFVANVGRGCVTKENYAYVFPNPGSDVVYGQDTVPLESGQGLVCDGSTVTTAATTTGFSGPTTTSIPTFTPPFPFSNSSTTAGPTNSTTTTGSSETNGTILTLTGSITDLFTTTTPMFITTTSASFPTLPATTTPLTIATSTLTTTSASLPTTPTTFTTIISSLTTTPTTSPTSTALPLPCTPGTFACNSPSTFSQCVSTSASSTIFVYMGSVAAGMQCVNGQFTRQNDGPCTPSGNIFCNGLSAFYMCDQGGLIPMGSVAAGTECLNGEIVPAGTSTGGVLFA
ncbi:hypothetical protein LTR84_005333 [Exophiala bonariae]|uniref:Chitin-binding type-4 domain-containing protein n=1 Tax=Exophiala bonariae TaxID=1690606 RepID=A0AAV9N7Q7_9EURO|nr:hypothetical protein LTR84_005333 [Exophiala bonariae]